MPRADNSAHLAQAARRRHDSAVTAAHDAIEHLGRQGHAVTFSAVATAAGVSRGWLYRQPDIRDLINRLRDTPAPTTPAGRASNESLRQRLDTAREEITRLRHENTALKDQLARHLGERRARHPTPTSINQR